MNINKDKILYFSAFFVIFHQNFLFFFKFDINILKVKGVTDD